MIGFIFIFMFIYCFSVITVLPFPPLLIPTPSSPTPTVTPPPLAMPMSLLSIFLCFLLPHLSHIIHLPHPLWSLSVCSFFPRLVLFFLFVCVVDYVPLIGKIIWYLSFITWLISLSIMFSSPIHAVTKGRSSFFLSFCCVVPHW